MRRLAGTVAPLVLMLAVLAPATQAATTHAEYVAQVNPICKDATRQAKRIPSQIKPTGDRFTDFLLATQRFGKLLGKTTRRIAAVAPAPGEEAAVRRLIDGLRQQRRLIRRYLRAVGHGDAKQAIALAERTARIEQRNRRRAANLGLPACSSGDQPG
jgi:hypothetical protein